jgi:glucokinase
VTKIIVADIGGTHARFALAEIDKRGVVALGDPVTLKTGLFGSAAAFAREHG